MLDINFNPFPILQTSRLILRRMDLSDAYNMYLMRSDKDVMRYQDGSLALNASQMEEKIKQIHIETDEGAFIQWTICISGDNQLVGTICLWNINHKHHRGEIGYMLRSEYHKKGIMTEAMATVIDFAFNSINLHSIEAQVTPENIPSIKILEKYDFVREAYFRENYLSNGRFIDTAVYSLLNSK